MTRAAFDRGNRGEWRATAVAALVLAGLPVAGPAAAQQQDGLGADHADMPVIAAPEDPGRTQPGALPPADRPIVGFNSFAASDLAPPSVGSFAAQQMPVVVELFTSQGCSSCPPADSMVARLSNDPGVLTLSYHVDYWDYLGWADSFAKPEFTARQEAYARAAGERALYTPQLIVDGQDTAVSPGPSQLMALIDASRIAPALLTVQRETTAEGEAIELMPLSEIGGAVEILLVRYAPMRKVEVMAGENRGRTVTYANVVLALDELAEWDGRGPLRLTVRPDGAPSDDFPADARHALLVQRETSPEAPGPILAAIRLD